MALLSLPFPASPDDARTLTLPPSGPNRRNRINETHMTTKKRNTPKKAAAKPRRAPRRNTVDEAFQALGRKLDDLLDGRNASAVAVHAWTAAPQDDRIVASYSQAEPAPPKPRSAIDEAIGRLTSAICAAECVTDSTNDRLGPLLSDPLPQTESVPLNPPACGTSYAAKVFNELADRLYADNRRRLALLDRLEL